MYDYARMDQFLQASRSHLNSIISQEYLFMLNRSNDLYFQVNFHHIVLFALDLYECCHSIMQRQM